MELEREDLIGKTVLDVLMNLEHTVVLLKTDVGDIYLSWVGECCSECYIAHVGIYGNYKGNKIAKILDLTFDSKTDMTHFKIDDACIHVRMGSIVQFETGEYIQFESRLESNGFYDEEEDEHYTYYDGAVRFSSEAPLDQYGEGRLTRDDEDFKYYPIVDF